MRTIVIAAYTAILVLGTCAGDAGAPEVRTADDALNTLHAPQS